MILYSLVLTSFRGFRLGSSVISTKEEKLQQAAAAVNTALLSIDYTCRVPNHRQAAPLRQPSLQDGLCSSGIFNRLASLPLGTPHPTRTLRAPGHANRARTLLASKGCSRINTRLTGINKKLAAFH